MSERLDIQLVHRACEALWPGRLRPEQFAEEVALGSAGLGLDSIDIVELVLECQELAGATAVGVERIFADGPVTVGRLVDRLTTS